MNFGLYGCLTILARGAGISVRRLCIRLRKTVRGSNTRSWAKKWALTKRFWRKLRKRESMSQDEVDYATRTYF